MPVRALLVGSLALTEIALEWTILGTLHLQIYYNTSVFMLPHCNPPHLMSGNYTISTTDVIYSIFIYLYNYFILHSLVMKTNFACK